MRENARDWNEWALAHGGSFLQSWEWGMFEERLGKKIVRFADEEWQGLMLRHVLPFGASYGYMPHGPVLAHPHDPSLWDKVLKGVRSACEKRTAFVRMEPRGASPETLSGFMRQLGCMKTARVQPEMTAFLDLKKPEEALLGSMEHDLRYAIRAAERRGVHIERYASCAEKERMLTAFFELYAETNARHGLRGYDEEYFREIIRFDPPAAFTTELFVAIADDRIVGAALIACFGRTATYLYAASRAGFGKLNAPSRIIWEAILSAQERGFTAFDLWGVSDLKKSWHGVTAFKRSFGGTEVSYAGTWDAPISRSWYYLYRMAKHLRR